MSLYSDLISSADELLRLFGASGTLIRNLDSTYDPATGVATPATPVSQACIAAVLDIDSKLVNGSSVLQDDKTAYLSPVGISAPRPGDKLTWGSVTYDVVTAKEIAPARVVVLYQLVIRTH
jgi:hypothetical protein